MIAKLEYWDKIDYYNWKSEVKRTQEIEAPTEIELFEQFFIMNDKLRYCNGSFYKFSDVSQEKRYYEWVKSPDFVKKSWNLIYRGDFVD